MSDPPVDTVAPWTIKSVGTATRLAVTEAARKEGITVGQWLDKRVAEWLADGAPVHVAGSSPAANPVGPAAALEMLANMSRAGVPPQRGVSALANRLVKQAMRDALGPPRKRVERLAAPAEGA